MTVLATGLLVAGASPALADTSEATANAATLSLNGNPLITTGSCVVSHPSDSSVPADVCSQNPTLGTLPGSGISVGALVQSATAPVTPLTTRPATSAACAGLVGPGGTIQIGAAGACSPTSPGGIVIDLGGLAQIQADAILAECTATAGPNDTTPGTGTTNVQLVNARIQLVVLGIPTGPPIPLVSSPAPNTPVVALGGLLNLTLNKQPPTLPPSPPGTPLPAGEFGTSALEVSLLGVLGGTPLVDLTIGTVTCGPNAAAPDVPVIPLKGLPVALATVAGVGLVAVIVRRRRNSVVSEI